MAKAVPTPFSGGLFAGKLAPEREFDYNGNHYVLWASKPSGGPNEVKVARKDGSAYTFVGVLKGNSFSDAGATGASRPTAHLQALAAAASNLTDKLRQKTGARVDQVAPLQEAVAKAEDVLIKDIKANACMVLNTGCFAVGTKILTRDGGWRAIESVEVGEWVLSRTEFDPRGATAWKRVEEKFERTGRILHLHVNGEVIRTTPEHLFYADGAGWVEAGNLRGGEWLCPLDGDWVPVGEVYDTEEYAPVFNLRVEDGHTYFVGDDAWGFAVWAHNDYLPGANAAYAQEAYGYVRRALYWRNNYVPQDELGGVTVAASRLNGVEIVVLYGTIGTAGGRYISQATVDAFGAAVRASGGRFYHAYRSFHAEEILYAMAPHVTAIGVTNRPCGACRAYFLDTQHFANFWRPPIP